jgi:hypothetical protein
MKIIIIILTLGAFFTSVSAHTMGVRKFKCPIDDTEFEAMQDFSGTSFGARLDLKKIGPIPQPWKLAQCPTCRLPLYEEHFEPAELTKLKEIIASEKFAKETKGATAYFTLGVIMEAQQKPPFEIGWIYLNASWEVEAEKANYTEAGKRSIACMDQAAVSLEKQSDKRDDYLLAKYLPIELSRRLGDFAEASRRLNAFPKTNGSEIEWLDDVLKLQAKLIKNKDSEPHEISESAPKMTHAP